MPITTREEMSSIVSVVYQTGIVLDQGDLQTIVGVFRGILAGFIATGLVTVTITASAIEPVVTSARVAPGISSSRPNVEFTGRG